MVTHYMDLKGVDDKLISAANQNNNNQIIKSKPIGTVVCRFWLEHRCKYNEACPHLHEWIEEKFPDCPKGASCSDPKCLLKHKECNLYKNGYCQDGKNCKSTHHKKQLCMNYLMGFCPNGPNCKLYHLKSMVPVFQDEPSFLTKDKEVFSKAAEEEAKEKEKGKQQA